MVLERSAAAVQFPGALQQLQQTCVAIPHPLHPTLHTGQVNRFNFLSWPPLTLVTASRMLSLSLCYVFVHSSPLLSSLIHYVSFFVPCPCFTDENVINGSDDDILMIFLILDFSHWKCLQRGCCGNREIFQHLQTFPKKPGEF